MVSYYRPCITSQYLNFVKEFLFSYRFTLYSTAGANMSKVKDTKGFVFSLWSRYYKSAKCIIMERELVSDWKQTMLLIVEELKHSKIKDQTKASRFVQSLFRSYFFNPWGFKRRDNIWQHYEESLERDSSHAIKQLYF